jgi:ADP-ribosyl-[dinitrogen reductase] hydrolase
VDLETRLARVLLGTAVGDALGLAAEGMSAEAIARRWGRLDRYRLLGARGVVSDDTEQSALVAQALARHPGDPARCAAAFRRSLVGWFWRLPWGVGMATARACLKASLGMTGGAASAGNGAAMRAALVGAFFHDRPQERRAFGEALARVTHRDERAVQGALFVAEVAAVGPGLGARAVVTEPSLVAALDRAEDLARRGEGTSEAAQALGTSGFVLHTVAFAHYCHLRHGPQAALLEAVNAGGDTDTIGAIVGAWTGAPPELVAGLGDGPFGRSHLLALAHALAEGQPPPRYSAARALARNLALYPVVIGHVLRRLLPW